MQRFTRVCLMLCLFCLVLLMTMTKTHAETVYAQYTAEDGIVFTSYSPAWASQSKLIDLHKELLQNVHGEEIKLLHQIKIFDDYPRGNGVAGQYMFQMTSSLLSGKPTMEPGSIELYGGKEHTSVASFARTLSHEYGHHVTHYYTLQADGFSLIDTKRWRNTSYATMRGLSNDKRVNVSGVDHRWQIAEIAAEDYVQLFGSPLAKAETPFASRVDQVLNGQDPGSLSWSATMYNVQPQENNDLPLASNVPGLYDFFYKRMTGHSGTYNPPGKPTLSLISYSRQGDVGNQLRFTWSVPGEQSNYNYTLVTYKDDDLLAEPIVTRTAAETNEARYGPVVVRKGAYIYTYQEPGAVKGTRHFKLFVFGPNGWVNESPELTVDMANPDQVKVSDAKVVPVKKTVE
ncbi:MAG: hypothetical protein ACXVPC_11965, partial [Tumebacillaceae bacterium]